MLQAVPVKRISLSKSTRVIPIIPLWQTKLLSRTAGQNLPLVGNRRDLPIVYRQTAKRVALRPIHCKEETIWLCHPERSEGSLAGHRSFAALRMTGVSSLWVKNDFNIASDPLIEFLKGSGRLRERQAMRNDLTRPGTTGDNHIAQLGVVALIRVATHANGYSFTEERLPRNSEITAFFDLPDRFRIVGEEYANNAKASVWIDQAGQIMNDLIGLLAGGISAVARLKPNRIDAAVHSAHALFPTPRRPSLCAEASALFQDLFHRVACAKVNRNGSQLPSFGQPLGDVVHHVHFGRPTQVQGTIGREQTDRASAENGHAIPRRDLSEFGCMIARGEGISQQHKIVLPLVPRFAWQAETVGIGKRDTDQLRLDSPVRSHAGIAIRRSDRSRVGGQARGAIAAHTVGAKATADVRGHHHPVTFADGDNSRADRFDDA